MYLSHPTDPKLLAQEVDRHVLESSGRLQFHLRNIQKPRTNGFPRPDNTCAACRGDGRRLGAWARTRGTGRFCGRSLGAITRPAASERLHSHQLQFSKLGARVWVHLPGSPAPPLRNCFLHLDINSSFTPSKGGIFIYWPLEQLLHSIYRCSTEINLIFDYQ